MVLALPLWVPSGAVVIFDCTRVNGALFALQIPAVLQHADILRAAGLGEEEPLHVFLRDLPWPLPRGGQAHVQHGDAIIIAPAGSAHFATASMAEMLAAVQGWNPDWAATVPYLYHTLILFGQSRTKSIFSSQSRPAAERFSGTMLRPGLGLLHTRLFCVRRTQ